jgi:hypothetical protein
MTTLAKSTCSLTLEERIQKLERENRRLKQIGTLLSVVIAVVLLMGQSGKNRSLDADSLVIRDNSGRVRMELGTLESDSSPTIKLFGGSDNKGASAWFESNGEGSSLGFIAHGVTLLSDRGSPSLLLADGKGGTTVDVASVHVYDSEKFSAILGSTETVDTKTGGKTKTSAGSITIFGKDGKVAWHIP